MPNEADGRTPTAQFLKKPLASMSTKNLKMVHSLTGTQIGMIEALDDIAFYHPLVLTSGQPSS